MEILKKETETIRELKEGSLLGKDRDTSSKGKKRSWRDRGWEKWKRDSGGFRYVW